ncbi:hypothetical protein ASPVEDRAFT_35976 [Aspergillus versicolor CBS 583.65]|uniref:Uncharacterized protein n=1 Tax=Aspergillus versicolor CBS 583.65 TaxID=1036611 RepID=A0A1L9P584_ASPVE|nr:uncharacterized protein ASPVEDRAFT_35976 [Aspergillus versicolor CBS 583.65]OJI96583.1 hypothetical protein ASPVEDRAFT_35976 [Aspergillus versicolor CBS 583.65]
MSFGLSLFAVFLSFPLLPGCASLARRYIYKRTPPANPPAPPSSPSPPPPPPPPPQITMATAEKQQQRQNPIKEEPLDDDKQDDFSDEYEDDYDDEEDDDQAQEDTSGKAVQARRRPGQTISSKDKPPAVKQKKGIDDEEGLKLKLDINLDIEVELKARIHGDLTLALLS